MTTVIQINNLWKKYRLGVIGHGTLVADIQSLWARMLGKEDPNAKVVPSSQPMHKQTGDATFWALRDINLEVEKGEVLGIIGKNGAGKSTLLKILSRVTAPTKGEVKIKGRVTSLLEVGTGFQKELTGRENIFLNGAILGMDRYETRQKLDEIIDFSGVGRHIDTPVKRYSSGMYVRLAFAVAAHLESEILIVDEVLAVGDAEFQKKCLGKMDRAAKAGRTILFVTHNLSSMVNLSTRAILIESGKIIFEGDKEKTVRLYIGKKNENNKADFSDPAVKAGMNRFAKFLNVKAQNSEGEELYDYLMGESLKISFEFELSDDIFPLELGFSIRTMMDGGILNLVGAWEGLEEKFSKGKHEVNCSIESLNLFPGTYRVTPWIKKKGDYIDTKINGAVTFSVHGSDLTGHNADFSRFSNQGGFQRSKWKVVS